MNELLDALHSSRDNWIHTAEELTPAAWRHRTSTESWSPAECAEHIVIVEDHLVGLITRRLAKGNSEPERAAALAGKEKMMRARIPGRTVKVKSPEPFVPTGRMDSPSVFIAEFQDARARSIELAVAADAGLETLVMPHFALGDLTGFQWLWFIALHSDRHLTQMREVLATQA